VHPDFLVIGAQKAGTTWLHAAMRAHEGVWLPPEKELHFFDERHGLEPWPIASRIAGSDARARRWRRQLERRVRRYRRVRPSRAELAWDRGYFFGRGDVAWYRSLFAPAGARLTGDFTPAYSTLDHDGVRRVHDVVPDARIVLMLRDPIERAWSHAVMDLLAQRGRTSAPDGEFLAHFDGAESRLRTDYGAMLERWADVFGAERMFVGFLDDVRWRPRELLSELYAFLGLAEPGAWPDLTRRVHGGSASSMPVRFARALAARQEVATEELAARLGGPAEWWRYCGARLRERPPAGEEIAYPFASGPLWVDWRAEHGWDAEPPALASGRIL
jgi:hypothetical protein